MSNKCLESLSTVRLQFADAYFWILHLIIPELETLSPLFSFLTLRFFYGDCLLRSGETLAEANIPDGSVLSIAVSKSWPVSTQEVWGMVEERLAPFMERRPLWQQLRNAGRASKSLQRFVRSANRNRLAEAQKAEPVIMFLEEFVLPRLGISKRVAELSPLLRESAAALALTDDELTEFVYNVCREDHLVEPERLLVWYPGRHADPQMAESLLIAARICESMTDIGPSFPLCNEDVDVATASLFRGDPDLPLIRRHLIQLQFLVQRPLAGGVSSNKIPWFLDFDKLSAAVLSRTKAGRWQ
jgi:hypothetical protein